MFDVKILVLQNLECGLSKPIHLLEEQKQNIVQFLYGCANQANLSYQTFKIARPILSALGVGNTYV